MSIYASIIATQRIHLCAPLAQHSTQPYSIVAAFAGSLVHSLPTHIPYQRSIAKETWSVQTQCRGSAVSTCVAQVKVACTQDVLNVMEIGQRNRSVAETKMNERSSRSHSVLTIIVDGLNNVTGIRTHGCLHLIDLAGKSSSPCLSTTPGLPVSQLGPGYMTVCSCVSQS